jgi:CBS domain-containing protein
MSAGRICTREVHTADPDESAQSAADRMVERGVGTLIVLNDSQQPVGIVTDRDLVTRVLARRRDPAITLLRDVMTSGPRTISEDASIESALSLMRGGGFRRIPVVDHKKALVGVLSLDDVLALLAEEFGPIGQLVERKKPPV